MTIHEALHAAGKRLAAAGVPSCEWDAQRLMLHVLDWDRGQLLSHLHETLPAAVAARYAELAAQRARRTPLQHLTQRQSFWRREFAVSPDVLIPRPETEVLVEAALARLTGWSAPLVVDVGTGSGCIALSIACDRPDASVHATELSAAALAVARFNAERLGCASRVQFHEGDLLAPVAALGPAIDMIVSNPPYVDRAAATTLEPEVRDHEPAMALFADGAADSVYRRLIPAAWPLLRPGGWLLVEIGLGMANGVGRLLGDAGFLADPPLPDLASIPRVIAAERPANVGSAALI